MNVHFGSGANNTNRTGYCQVDESRPNIVGLQNAPSTIPAVKSVFEALNLTVPPYLLLSAV